MLWLEFKLADEEIGENFALSDHKFQMDYLTTGLHPLTKLINKLQQNRKD